MLVLWLALVLSFLSFLTNFISCLYILRSFHSSIEIFFLLQVDGLATLLSSLMSFIGCFNLMLDGPISRDVSCSLMFYGFTFPQAIGFICIFLISCTRLIYLLKPDLIGNIKSFLNIACTIGIGYYLVFSIIDASMDLKTLGILNICKDTQTWTLTRPKFAPEYNTILFISAYFAPKVILCIMTIGIDIICYVFLKRLAIVTPQQQSK